MWLTQTRPMPSAVYSGQETVSLVAHLLLECGGYGGRAILALRWPPMSLSKLNGNDVSKCWRVTTTYSKQLVLHPLHNLIRAGFSPRRTSSSAIPAKTSYLLAFDIRACRCGECCTSHPDHVHNDRRQFVCILDNSESRAVHPKIASASRCPVMTHLYCVLYTRYENCW